MNNNFNRNNFSNTFDYNLSTQKSQFHIPDTVQHTFDQRSLKNISHQNNFKINDSRTEDQVRNDLNFSIDDLLNKISKATASFEQTSKIMTQNSKNNQLNGSFKISSLSASTQTNSNHERSDNYIEKYEPFVEVNKKRQSQPQKDAFSYNDRFKSTYHKQNDRYRGFGEIMMDNKNQVKINDFTSPMIGVQKQKYINQEFNKQKIKNQSFNQSDFNSSKNHPKFQVNSQMQIRQTTKFQSFNQFNKNYSNNQSFNSYKQIQTLHQWGRSSSKYQPKIETFNNQPNILQLANQWGRKSTKNQSIHSNKQLTTEPFILNSNSKKNTENFYDWKNNQPANTINQWGRNSSKNQFKVNNKSQWQKQKTPTKKYQQIQKQSNHVNTNQYFQNTPAVQNFTGSSINNQSKTKQYSYQWGRNSSKNQPFTYQSTNEWKSSQKIKTKETQNYSTKQTKIESHQKLQFQNPFVNILKNVQNQKLGQQNRQNINQTTIQIQIKGPQQQITIHENQQSFKSPQKQIQALLSPFQVSAFGKAPGQLMNKSDKNKFIASSIILEDDLNAQNKFQQIPIEEGQKVNSLFDVKKIRQVAASTIIDSPDKMKKIKNASPFLQIISSSSKDPIQQCLSKDNIQNQRQCNAIIKITKVQKSEIVQQTNKPKIKIQDFHLGKQLGSGKFGDVYQAIHKQTGLLYAIKKIFKSTILEYNMIEQFTRQLKIHYSLNYPNIIKLYTHFDDQYHIFLVMEYGEGGMLMQKVKNGQKFTSVIVQQMLRSVEYLQNKKIAHRDIKPENIVLMFEDTAKMCDFGWSRVFDSDMKKTFCGTLDYVSPQMKDKGEYSLKIDVWSLGVLTFQLLCGYAPFKDEINNWKRKGGNLNKAWNWNILYPPQISSVAQSFMRNLLKQNPSQRANIRFCLNHLFIRKYSQFNFDEEQDKRYKEIAIILKDEN